MLVPEKGPRLAVHTLPNLDGPKIFWFEFRPKRGDTVGSRAFVEAVKEFSGIRAKGRDVIEGGESYHLRGEAAAYEALFYTKKSDIGTENADLWDLNPT